MAKLPLIYEVSQTLVQIVAGLVDPSFKIGLLLIRGGEVYVKIKTSAC